MKSNFIATITTFLLAIVLSLFAYQTESIAQTASQHHTVQSGETLFSIARDYNLTVGDIRRWNDLESDNLSNGQVLRIAPPVADNQITHTVQQGETMFAISRRYSVTIAEIQQWNDLRSTNLEIGQELTIFQQVEDQRSETPPPAESEEQRQSIVRVSDIPTGNAYYNVRSGDTLFRIAAEHGMTVSELKQLNNLEDDILRIGQQLTVRKSRSSAPSVAETAESSTPQGRFVQYRIQSGENSSSVLQKFQMSLSELRSLNPGIDHESLTSGQRITVLLPPTRTFANPYRKGANLENLGQVAAFRYRENEIAASTTSGELYNPDQLTAAHSNMALGNVVYIENTANGKGIFVRINDRHSGEGLKLSHKAFEMLGFSSIDKAQVTIFMNN